MTGSMAKVVDGEVMVHEGVTRFAGKCKWCDRCIANLTFTISFLLQRALLLLAWPLLAWSSPLPDKPLGPAPSFGGFTPLTGSRGAGPSSGYSAPSPPVYTPPASDYSAPSVGYSAPSSGYSAPSGGYSSEPHKTIYVNVPSHKPQPPLPPVAAGPPRRHYKIVFIRAPPPPPQTQAILPPRTEQKTLIYVLHQRPEDQPQVVEVPHVPHDPEVYFVEYDTPPTAHDLQQLSSGNLDGFTVTSQQGGYGGGGGSGLGVGAGISLAAGGDDVYKRSVGIKLAEGGEATQEALVST